jgi:hypothetical protein
VLQGSELIIKSFASTIMQVLVRSCPRAAAAATLEGAGHMACAHWLLLTALQMLMCMHRALQEQVRWSQKNLEKMFKLFPRFAVMSPMACDSGDLGSCQ